MHVAVVGVLFEIFVFFLIWCVSTLLQTLQFGSLFLMSILYLSSSSPYIVAAFICNRARSIGNCWKKRTSDKKTRQWNGCVRKIGGCTCSRWKEVKRIRVRLISVCLYLFAGFMLVGFLAGSVCASVFSHFFRVAFLFCFVLFFVNRNVRRKNIATRRSGSDTPCNSKHRTQRSVTHLSVFRVFRVFVVCLFLSSFFIALC